MQHRHNCRTLFRHRCTSGTLSRSSRFEAKAGARSRRTSVSNVIAVSSALHDPACSRKLDERGRRMCDPPRRVRVRSEHEALLDEADLADLVGADNLVRGL
jgi:hypothetical protein